MGVVPEPIHFVRFFWVDAAQAEFAFLRDFSTGPVVSPTSEKVEYMLPPEGNVQTVRSEVGQSSTGIFLISLVDVLGEISQYVGNQNLTLATALSVGGGETEVVFNETPDGIPRKGTLQVENERIRYTSVDELNKKVTGITRAVDGTALAAHAIGTTGENGEEIRPGIRAQLFSGGAADAEAAFFSYTKMEVVGRRYLGGQLRPVYVIEVADAQRFTRKRVFLTATNAVPITRNGNPITVMKNFLLNDVQVPSVLVDSVSLDSLATDAEFTGQVYEFSIREPVNARDWLRALHLSTNTYPFVTREGKLGARKLRLPPAPTKTLDETNIVGIPQWTTTDQTIINQASIRYDFDLDDVPNAFKTIDVFEDVASRDKFGLRNPLVIEARGIKTSQNGAGIARDRAQRVFDRFARPVSVLVVRAFFGKLPDLEIGDPVSITHSKVPNLATGKLGITSESFELTDLRPVFGIAGPDNPPHLQLTLAHTGALSAAAVPTPSSSSQTLRVTDSIAPATPTGLVLTPGLDIAGDGSAVGFINVNWIDNVESDLSHYLIEWRENTVGEKTFGAIQTPSEFKIASLKPGVEYAVKVAAVDLFGNRSAFTAESLSTIPSDPGAPTTPAGLVATAFPLAVALTWNLSPEQDIIRYEVERADDAGFTVNVSIIARPLSTAFVDKNVPAGATRHYRIRSVRRTGALSGFTAGVNATALEVSTTDLANLAVTSAKIADAAIVAAKIAALAVTEAKIAALAVTNAKIANLAVDGAKIADAAVTNAKIADAAITNAKIANLSVDTAKIQDLTVTTLKIVGEAVSKRAQATAGDAVVASGAFVDKVSVVFTSGGGDILIVTKVNYKGDGIGGALVETRILEGGVQIDFSTYGFDISVGQPAAAGANKAISGTILRAVGAGTRTYKMQVRQTTGANQTFGDAVIMIWELKK